MKVDNLAHQALPKDTSARSTADWERIEAEYRAGVRTLREIAGEHDITEGSIRKRAKRDEWSRDLNAKVRAKADALVRKELVRKEVRKEALKRTEKQVVEIEATVQSRIRLAHRTDIAKARSQVVALFDELENETSRATDEQKAPRLTLGARTSIARALTEALRTAIGLEREAYSIAQVQGADNPLAALIAQLGPSAVMPIVADVPDEP